MRKVRFTIPERELVNFCRRYGVKRLSILGSAQRKALRPGSDVDLPVEFLPGTQVGFVTLSRMQRELTNLLGRRVDLVPREGLKPRIRESVLAGAEDLYATRIAKPVRHCRGGGCCRTVRARSQP